MNKPEDFRDLAKVLRKSADIAERIAENGEDETLGKEEKEEKEEQLLAEFIVQLMKIKSL